MGSCCSSKKDPQIEQKQIELTVKIQAIFRSYKARKELKKIRESKINQLFGGLDIQNASQGSQNNGPSHKKDNKNISQIDKLPLFKLSPGDLDQNDGIKRVYIDEFKDVGDGRLYKGQWNKKTGERDGVGIQFWPDGSKYEGVWRNDRANGKGRMTHANGDIYEGLWRDDKANGFGVFIDTNNARYEGEWLDDQQHGYGVETWDNGAAKYSGQFYKGKKNGKGKFEWEDGSYYEGDFVDGQFQGFGKYYFADLDKVYQGEFRMSNMEGKGTEIWSDGRRYDGDFKNGKKDGEGTFEWPNGNKYIGSWKNGKQHGIAIWHDGKDATKKQGEWVMGKRHRWIDGMEMLAQPSPGRGTRV